MCNTCGCRETAKDQNMENEEIKKAEKAFEVKADELKTKEEAKKMA